MVRLVQGLLSLLIFTSTVPAAAAAGGCVFTDLLPGELCPVSTQMRAIEILGMGDDAVIFLEPEITATTVRYADSRIEKHPAVEKTSIVASSRLEDAVLMESMAEDEAVLAEQEIVKLSGARYVLPNTRNELLVSLGFPMNMSDVPASEWIEMLRVHLERSMSVSATTSEFLMEQIGVTENTAATATTITSAPIVVKTY